jgi:putative peptidoglycan lipid II flippase
VSERRSLLQAAVFVFVVTTLGRLLGFVRDLVIAQYFGATSTTDAFLIAWMIPETVSPLLLDGAMSFVLIPLFARELEARGTLREFVGRTLLPVATVLLAVSIVVALGAPLMVRFLAPGLAEPDSAVQMVRIVACTVLFIGLAGYVGASLRAHQVFGIPAAVYVAYNVGILACILILAPRLDIYSAALGLALGSLLMLAVQVPAFLRKEGLPRLSFKVDRTLAYELAAFVPVGMFSLGRHAQVYVERFLGSFLDPGAISKLHYAARVGQFPMFAAITVAIVSFPSVARAMAGQRTEEVRQALESDLRMVSTLILPAMTVLVVFAPEVVTLLFERGAFTDQDTAATASMLRVYSLGLLAQALVYAAVRPFFTRQSSVWVPVRAAVVGLVVTVAVDIVLLSTWGATGLAAGNAAGISVMALLLVLDMRRYVTDVDLRSLLRFLIRLLIAASLAGACALPVTLLENSADLPPIVVLALGSVVAGLAYFVAGRAMRIEELEELRSLLSRALGLGRNS